MNLGELIDVLDGAGVNADAFAILDAIWLAHEMRSRSPPIEAEANGDGSTLLPDGPRPLRQPFVERGKKRGATHGKKSDLARIDERPDAQPPEDPSRLPVYPSGDPFGGSRRAAAISTGGAFTVFDSLGFLRALRPFRQKIASRQGYTVDEEATAQMTAEASVRGATRVFPVTAPLSERWFEVDLVTEDDAATALWRESLEEFANTLRVSGAFRNVREWRLEVGTARGLDKLHAAGGATIPTQALYGNGRRLVLFASHGSSRHWSNGIYERVLSDWCLDCSVALLHLLPSTQWGRTPLGEPLGNNSTTRPGVANRDLLFNPNWWVPIDPLVSRVSLPMVEMSPSAVGKWSAMLMARGVTSSSLRLDPTTEEVRGDEEVDESDQIVTRRVGAVLSASPKAFQLAALLSSSPFTVPVARLIQESQFGRSDHQDLSRLFMSGLLRLVPGQPSMTVSPWFEIDKRAAGILGRSLAPGEAEAVSRVLLQRVTDLIATATGDRKAVTSLTLADGGAHVLPDWAKPFALVASQLRRTPEVAFATRFSEFLSSLSPRNKGALARLAATQAPLTRAAVPPTLWERLLDRSLTQLDEGGERQFTEGTKRELEQVDRATPLLGCRILWVDDRPGNNRAAFDNYLQMGAEITNVLATNDALSKMGTDTFDLVISDMARKEGEREGLVLIRRMRELRNMTPIVIFAGGFAKSKLNRQEAVRAGAFFCTNSFDSLARHVLRLYREPGRRADEVFQEVPPSVETYVEQASLPPPMRASEYLQTSLEYPGEGAFLVGSVLVECDARIGVNLTRALVGQLLLAELSRSTSSRSSETPFSRFATVLSNLGWHITEAVSEIETLAPFASMIHTIVMPSIRSMAGAGPKSKLAELLGGISPNVPDAEWLRMVHGGSQDAVPNNRIHVCYLDRVGEVLRLDTRCFESVIGRRGSHGGGENGVRVEMAVLETSLEHVLALRSAVDRKVIPYGQNIRPLYPSISGGTLST
ncbi:response regulator [Rhizobium ruizarguesonis]|uniref:response regulator n=1 Tax=Rhizobium ruizarguesonis TaxID=2081791 RepID=UPI00102F2F14|nr:response regulator [Rhizobium ruizarguesonis]TBA29366.1 response regulator [Rhizobium ruizarguesonis]TBA30324.1 response regulator [Rhizobium ruizarguesonis]